MAAGAGLAAWALRDVPVALGVRPSGEWMRRSPQYRDGKFRNRVPATVMPPGSGRAILREALSSRHRRHPSHSNCPCLSDKPLIGADANGFFITTNEFGPITDLANTSFNGAQIYPLLKTALENAMLAPTIHSGSSELRPAVAASMLRWASVIHGRSR